MTRHIQVGDVGHWKFFTTLYLVINVSYDDPGNTVVTTWCLKTHKTDWFNFGDRDSYTYTNFMVVAKAPKV